MIRKLVLSLALLAGVSMPLIDAAQAAVGDGIVSGSLSSVRVSQAENTQFFFGGNNFCWYYDGWQGPGWYWCGYAWRRGYGWGGGEGYHGWHRGPGGFRPHGPGGFHPHGIGGFHPHGGGGLRPHH